MFGEFTNLFGRNFTIGFLLPTTTFAISTLFMLDSFGFFASGQSPLHVLFPNDKEFLGATVFAFVLWMGAALLLALNRTIIRFKEGYGSWNPFKLIAFVERRRFLRLTERLEALDSDLALGEELQGDKDLSLIRERTLLRRLAAERFPDKEGRLLPTAFGNTIRAFEAYPFVMYGLDPIPAWPRLIMLMPDNDREAVDTAKAQTSFWVNLWLLSLIFFVEYVVLRIDTGRPGTLWALISIPLAWIASLRAQNAATMWGEVVKAAFDMYIPKLRKRLELDATLSPEQEREQWVRMGNAMVFRDPRFLPYYRERLKEDN